MKPTTLRFDRLEARLAPAVATWDGGGADNRWTTAANWVGDVAPNPGDDLKFPDAAQPVNVNDFPAGTPFHSLTVTGRDFQLTGNAVALAAGLNVSSNPGITVGLPLILTVDQTFDGRGADYTLSGSVDLNGHALRLLGGTHRFSGPIIGNGSLTVDFAAALLSGVSTFTGPTTVSGIGVLDVRGTLPGPVTASGSSRLTGTGTVGDVTVNARLEPGDATFGSSPTVGTLKTGNLDLTHASSTRFKVLAPGSGSSVAVTGTAQLGGFLEIQAPPDFRGFGRPYTVIDNDGTDPVVGTFANAPEGGVFNGNFFGDTTNFRITYRGGDGNDVVLTDTGPAYAVGAGAGGVPNVNVYAADGRLVTSLLAYASSFRGGVRVATADVTGDGVPDIITAPGPGGGPHVKVFDGSTFAVVRDFMAYDPRFTGGVFVAASLITGGDHQADIITGAGAGGGPHVKVFDGATGATLSSFFAYDSRFTGGVSVAGTDWWNIGHGIGSAGSVITGAGPGGGPHVRVFNGMTGAATREFFAYDAAFRGGVNVASRGQLFFAGGLIGPPSAVGAIVTAPASNGVPEVRQFGPTGQQIGSFLAYDSRFLGGVTVGVQEITPNRTVTLQTGAGRGGGPHVKTWQVANNVATLQQSFYAFDAAFLGGVFVG